MSKRKTKYVVQVCGGVGNQMFQYAFAYALMKETNTDVILDPFYWKAEQRDYVLDSFNISIRKYFIPRIIDRCLGASLKNGEKLVRKSRNKLIDLSYKKVYEAQTMHYDGEIMHQADSSYFIGYWQAEKFFGKYRDDIRKELSLKMVLSDQCKKMCTVVNGDKASVALHIRRTDYLSVSNGIALNLSYYDDALKLIEDKLGKCNLYIFSDDKDFIRGYYKNKEYTLIENLSDLEEFEVMRNCTHHIIANSTFSWWAAYLGNDQNGIVCAPSVDRWTGDFYPENWNLIDARTDKNI